MCFNNATEEYFLLQAKCQLSRFYDIVSVTHGKVSVYWSWEMNSQSNVIEQSVQLILKLALRKTLIYTRASQPWLK